MAPPGIAHLGRDSRNCTRNWDFAKNCMCTYMIDKKPEKIGGIVGKNR